MTRELRFDTSHGDLSRFRADLEGAGGLSNDEINQALERFRTEFGSSAIDLLDAAAWRRITDRSLNRAGLRVRLGPAPVLSAAFRVKL